MRTEIAHVATERDHTLALSRAMGSWLPTELSMLLLRTSSGLLLALAYGINKIPPTEGFVSFVARLGFPEPLVFGWAAGIAEFGGGILLALGLLTRPAAFLIAATMAVAAFVAEAGNNLNERAPALILMMIAITFLIAGPGRFSLDAFLGKLIRRS